MKERKKKDTELKMQLYVVLLLFFDDDKKSTRGSWKLV